MEEQQKTNCNDDTGNNNSIFTKHFFLKFG